jgi:hypothetical protein
MKLLEENAREILQGSKAGKNFSFFDKHIKHRKQKQN